MRIVYAALVALAVTAPQFIVRVPVAVAGVALSCADATTRCVPSEYATPQLAANVAVAGDIVWVSAGTYVQTVAAVNSGTAGNTITFLANGAVTICGMTFSSKSYIRVIGFTMDPNASTCGGSPSPIVHLVGTTTGIEFWNNTVGNLAGHGIANTSTTDRCAKCIIVGGSVHDLSNGNNGITLLGDDIFVGYVNLSTICYQGVDPSGARWRIVNVNYSDFRQCNTTHPDFLYIDASGASTGFSTSLVEANFGIGTITSNDNKYFHAQNQSSVPWIDDVWRLNVSYNTGSAAAFSMYASSNTLTRWKFYNNTSTYGDRATSSGTVCGSIQNLGGGAITYSVYDTIFYQCWGDSATTSILPWDTTNPTTMDRNLAFSPLGSVTFLANWATQAHPQTNVDPKLTNTSGLDFTLQSTSPARSAGGALTSASGSGVASTALTVATDTGGFFIGDNSANLPAYGGRLVPGDFLTVGSCTAQAVSVSGDTITLATACTWANADPVYFGSRSTVDIGAYPYKAGGYTLSGTFHQAGSTVTVTPNDATLARFAVVYENLIPTCIADASNAWACTVGSGVVTVTLYPRYASQTQSVAATGT